MRLAAFYGCAYMDRNALLGDQGDDLSPEEIAAARRRNRMNALILGLVFLLSAVAPPPWSSYAPVLMLIPIIYMVLNRIRKSPVESGTAVRDTGKAVSGGSETSHEPYSYVPKNPKDPRRYKPLG